MKINASISISLEAAQLKEKMQQKGIIKNLSIEVEKMIIALAKKHQVK